MGQDDAKTRCPSGLTRVPSGGTPSVSFNFHSNSATYLPSRIRYSGTRKNRKDKETITLKGLTGTVAVTAQY